jgi:hypothetical protein
MNRRARTPRALLGILASVAALGPDALALYDVNMNRVVEPGLFDLMVGPSSEQLTTVALEVTAK